MESRFDGVIEAEVSPDGPGVAVAVLRDGKFIHRKAYGLADLEWGTPLTPDCTFRIASLTKQFAAVAIMMLVERGLVDLDDPIERHLPTWAPRGRTITVRHLLNHTSGIRPHDAYMPARTERANLRIAEVLASVYQAPFDFEPGERYRYNNSGYLLLGSIIEAASGLRFEGFLKAEVFEPLGMSRSGLMRHGDIVPQRARGYVRGANGLHNARPDADGWSYAAGGLGSTLDDLALWDAALRTHRLIRPETFETMLAPTVLADGSAFPYGFGWGTGAYGGARLYHHTGGISGFACQMLHLRDQALTTIVLSNLYLFPYDRVTRGLLRVAMDLPALAMSAHVVEPADLAGCAGTYGADDDGEIVVRDDAEAAGRLLRLGDGRFCEAADPEVEQRFSDLQGCRYHTLEIVSPLWPVQRFMRRG